jgi:hypothetical protein
VPEPKFPIAVAEYVQTGPLGLEEEAAEEFEEEDPEAAEAEESGEEETAFEAVLSEEETLPTHEESTKAASPRSPIIQVFLSMSCLFYIATMRLVT